jgi:ketosteroid isomerase-like protein
MNRMVRVIAAGGLALAAGCGPKPDSAPAADGGNSMAETAAVRSAIDALNAQYVAHFNAVHPDSLAALFAEDGRMMPPNAPVAVGHAAIVAGLATMAGSQPTLALTTVAVETSGPLAVETGTYAFSLMVPGAKEPIKDTGKYVSSFRKVGDKWMLVDNIWNSDMVMPMPASKP